MIAAAVLGLILVIGLPARALLRSRHHRPKRSRTIRYAETIAEIAVLLMGLTAIAYWHGIAPAELGLGWPPPRAGQIGLLLGVLLIAGAATAVVVVKPRRDSRREQEALGELPQGRRETALFIALGPAAGIGWEAL